MRKIIAFAVLAVLALIAGCASTDPEIPAITAATAPQSEPEPTPAPAPEPANDVLSDDGWTLAHLEVSEDFFGHFQAIGRATNGTGSDVGGAILELTLLDPSGAVVVTMIATVTGVAAGETATAKFWGADDYVEGDWTVELALGLSY